MVPVAVMLLRLPVVIMVPVALGGCNGLVAGERCGLHRAGKAAVSVVPVARGCSRRWAAPALLWN